MTVSDFRDLRVYQGAFEAAAQLFEVTKGFPREERYSLTDQVRRSSRAICTNIAEAWRKRRYPAAFISKLSDADTEAAETQVWLDIALRCEYLNDDLHEDLSSRYNHICAQLVRMINDADRWCGNSPNDHPPR